MDQSPEEREQPLSLSQLVDCDECGATFDHVFVCEDGVTELEDLTEAPEDRVACVNCGHVQEVTYEGWIAHQDAG